MTTRLLTLAIACVALLTVAAPAHAAGKKAIWGPLVLPAGNANCPSGQPCSAFPTYAALGVDTFQLQIHWDEIAPTPPADPRNPADPAYQWKGSVDAALLQASISGVEVAMLVQRSPSWANGGNPPIWAPDPKAFGDFLHAAASRYPGIRKWMIWGEPTRNDSFQPMEKNKSKGPRTYARILNAAYKALKETNRANVVIGGMSVNAGTVTPGRFLDLMERKGKMPKMDLWGHNPFDPRPPRLKDKPIGHFRGLNDVDTLWGEITKAYKGQKKKGRPKGLFLSEWTLPTDHPAPVFGDGFFVSRAEQAQRITAAFRIVNRLKYVKALGYFTLMDEPGATANAWGLTQADGVHKPGFYAYASAP